MNIMASTMHQQLAIPITTYGGQYIPHHNPAVPTSPLFSPATSPMCQPQPPMQQISLSNYNMLINYSMELVWHGEFNRLFQSLLPHRWFLNPTFSLPKGRKWIMFKDSAKVRFLCKDCSHGWTSMKGRVVFWFSFDEQRNTGLVLFRLFGQRCQSCSPKLFEHAMWYPEEVVKVVGNIFNRIGQEYYGFYSPPVRIDRRAGKPRSQHNAQLCQACSEGICPGEFDDSVETFGLYKKSPMTSSSITSSGRSHCGSMSSQCSLEISSISSLTSESGAEATCESSSESADDHTSDEPQSE